VVSGYYARMSTTITLPNLPKGMFMTQKVKDYNPDGVTLDTTEQLSVMSNNSSICAISIDPDDNRKVKIVGVSPGTTILNVGAPGVPSDGYLFINVTVTAPPNLSRIEADGAAEGPFPVV
jgi:hypothetical protein